jgi:hypothetical protein
MTPNCANVSLLSYSCPCAAGVLNQTQYGQLESVDNKQTNKLQCKQAKQNALLILLSLTLPSTVIRPNDALLINKYFLLV